jgi:hypothetical protein
MEIMQSIVFFLVAGPVDSIYSIVGVSGEEESIRV